MKIKSIRLIITGLLLVPIVALGMGFIVPDTTLAAGINDGYKTARGDNTPSCLFTTPKDHTGSLDSDCQNGVVTVIANTALFILGSVAVIMLIYGGVRYTISGGDDKAVTAAKNTILYAVVGIVVAMAGYAIVNFVIGTLVV